MLYAVITIIVLIVIFSIVQINSLVSLRQLTMNAWSDVEVYLKRRADLIPNLVSAVKGYAGYEQAVLTAVIEARTNALNRTDPSNEKQDAENKVSGGLGQIIAISENYPDLKADTEFMSLQDELRNTEKLIANARQFYNACVRDLNTKIESFPSSIFAGILGMKIKSFFELESAFEAEVPRFVQ